MPIFSAVDPSKGAARPNPGGSIPENTSAASSQAETVNHRPATKRVMGREAFSTPSIMDALRDVSKKDESGLLFKSSDHKEVKPPSQNPFSQNELAEAWKNFVDAIESAQLKSALSAREPVLADNWKVEYELDSELQLNRLTLDLKPKMLGFLRERFKNEMIEIHFSVSAANVQQSRTPYTEAERWDSLVEKFPALAALKSKFGLDFEHL